MADRSTAWRVGFVVICLAAGALFFLSLGRLWPLARTDLVLPSSELTSRCRAFLEERGFDLTDYRAAASLSVDSAALDYVESAFGRRRAQAWIAEGRPLVRHVARFKKRGERSGFTVEYHAEGGVLGWRRTMEEDAPGARLEIEAARALAREALASGLRLDPEAFEERSASTRNQAERRDHTFGYERRLSVDPELRERVWISVAGAEVVWAQRLLVVPGAAARAARAAEAPGRAVETVGFALLAAGGLAAFFIFLRRLRDGSVHLGRALLWPGVVLVCLSATQLFETARLLANWEPLWPRWVSGFTFIVQNLLQRIWVLLALLAVVGAGDALDRAGGGERGRSLWLLARGRLTEPSVARASWRGFLVGLLCGGTMAAAVLLLELAGGRTSIQPRGFFFYTLNSAAPAATSLLFFSGVALAEELGYRFFAGSWLWTLTGRRWLAIFVPALVYGLTHTRLDFLPTAEPWWGRPLVLTLVGVVWGWAFFRFDALTVVLSHFTADLFIFNWPRLASGDSGVIVISVLTVTAPLLPAVLFLFRRRAAPTATVA